jgi:predicted NodU family carbamoyl transferase
LSSAFDVSPFEKAVILSIDGFWDFASAAWGVGEGVTIRVDGHAYSPHSLGVFYQAITQFLGFPHYGDEYKAMGLAPYGRPTLVEAMRQIVQLHADGTYALNLHFFRHQHARIGYQWTDGAPETADLFSSALEPLLGPRRKPEDPLDDRHRDIACSAQAMCEEAFFHLLNTLQARTGLTDLTLAGGCAMNSLANGKVRRRTPFRRLYVQSAAGDAGGAIGAAYWTWHRLGGARSFVMDHAYWGPHFDTGVIDALLNERSDARGPHSIRPWNQPITLPSAIANAVRRQSSTASTMVSTVQGESVEQPLLYHRNNVAGSTALFRAIIETRTIPKKSKVARKQTASRPVEAKRKRQKAKTGHKRSRAKKSASRRPSGPTPPAPPVQTETTIVDVVEEPIPLV